MALEFAANEYTFRVIAAIPILLLGLYVFKSNAKETSNRIFALFCLLWTMWIVSLNFVSLSTELESAALWNRLSVYSALLLVPVLIHFVLMFPYRSSLLRRRWLLPTLYGAGLLGLAWSIVAEGVFIPGPPTIDAVRQVYSPEARPSLYFAFALGFTIAVLLLVLRYLLTDLEITRKRLFFVVFALSTYALYEGIGDVHTNRDEQYLATFMGHDHTYWRLTLATHALLILTLFSLVLLLALRTRNRERRTEAWLLLGSGFAALVTGYFDPIISVFWRDYPGVLWLWRISAAALMFYAILRYQLFDLHVRIRIGVKYGTMTTAFAAIFFTIQEIVKDLGGQALGYFMGLLAAAALVFLFEPFQRFLERFSQKVVPPTTSENYERYRSMEIYRAALEGALADKVVSPNELTSLRKLREKLGVTDEDHRLLERDIRTSLDRGGL